MFTGAIDAAPSDRISIGGGSASVGAGSWNANSKPADERASPGGETNRKPHTKRRDRIAISSLRPRYFGNGEGHKLYMRANKGDCFRLTRTA